MTNNAILKKLSIALNLRHEAILSVFQQSDSSMNLSQVKGYMVSPSHKNYLELGDEKLEAFLNNLIDFSRGEKGNQQLPVLYRHLIISLADKGRLDALEELIECASDAMAAAMEDNLE